MKLVITTPSLSPPHGGIRVLCEWANYLSKYHDVSLYVQSGSLHCTWLPLKVRTTNRIGVLRQADLVVIGSPHSIHLERFARKSVIFMQMVEHLFTNNKTFHEQCKAFYNSPNLLLSISKWNIDYLIEQGRVGEIKYIRNGINLVDFPIIRQQKENAVLIEGWESGNKSKDSEHVAPQVAERLRAEGYKILAYSQKPLMTFKHVPHEYHKCPSLAQLNNLYGRAKILIKASHFDARSTSPMEAMTKGTPTARAIDLGDDDLIDGVNCLRVPYGNVEDLYNIAKKLLTDDELYGIISNECVRYIETQNWDTYIVEISDILVDYVNGRTTKEGEARGCVS